MSLDIDTKNFLKSLLKKEGLELKKETDPRVIIQNLLETTNNPELLMGVIFVESELNEDEDEAKIMLETLAEAVGHYNVLLAEKIFLLGLKKLSISSTAWKPFMQFMKENGFNLKF